MQNRVLVLDRNKQPLMPCHPARARALLKAGKAAVFRRFPFTLILKDRAGGEVQDTRLKLNPRSEITGIAMLSTFARRGPSVVWAAEITYQKPQDRMAPPLQIRVDTTITWVNRLLRWVPIATLSTILYRFDMQLLKDIKKGEVNYEHDTLNGYEIREYLLEKWGHKCAYCDAENAPLTIDHILPKSRGGSDQVSNLTLACVSCNQSKSNQGVRRFLRNDLKRRRWILSQAKTDLRSSGASRICWAIWNRLENIGLDVEVGTVAEMKHNRNHQGYPRTPWLDAACTGASGSNVRLDAKSIVLQIQSTKTGYLAIRVSVL